MAENELVDDTPSRIFIQINGEKTACVKSALSKTVAEFRTILLSQEVQLPRNTQFFDAQGYPVSVINEKSFNIRNLVISTTDGKTIKLRTKERTTNVETQRSVMKTVTSLILIMATLYFAYYISNEDNRKSFIHKLLCPVLINMNLTSLLDVFNCSINQSIPDDKRYIDTTLYLKNQIMNDSEGAEVLVSTGKELKKVESTGSNNDYVSMYDDWVRNETIYKADYGWYNNMLANWGHCPGSFDEKVMHSNNIIKDTPESIQQFINDEFQDWPQKLRVKLNIENRLKSATNDDGDGFDLGINGKISSNMYLAAWRREEDNTVHIHTYVTIFERTAGHGCWFNPEYWNGKRDKITNAKKYFLLTKVKTNPAYKAFLLSIPQIQ